MRKKVCSGKKFEKQLQVFWGHIGNRLGFVRELSHNNDYGNQ